MTVGHRLVHIGEFRVDLQGAGEILQGTGEILLGLLPHAALVETALILVGHVETLCEL